MNDIPRTEVLVVGAGPTGLTLACDLARRGVAHRVVEREPVPNRASKAKTIQSRSLEVLDDLGALAPVLRRGVAGLPVRFHEPAGTVDRPSISVRAKDRFHTPYPDALWIGQFDVEHALRQRLAALGGRVEFGTEAVGLEQDDAGVTVALRTPHGPRTVRARYVVAADGGRSGTRGLAGLPLIGETYDKQRWYLGDLTVPGLDRGRIHIWPSTHGMLGLTPLPGSDLWQFQSPILAGTEPGTPSRELYQRLFDERAGAGAVDITSATWLSVYRVNVRMADGYRRGRVLLAGDAAHVHSPAGGQGMNTGIQDAYNLGWKLAHVLGGADPDLLDTYTAERVPVARRVLAASTGKIRAFTARADRSSEDGLSTALDGIADGDMTTGLGIHYRTGPLTLRAGGTAGSGSAAGDVTGSGWAPGDTAGSGPAPGDRAPDACGPVSVFELLRGPHWSLLAHEHPGPLLLDHADPAHLRVHRLTEARFGEFRRVYRPEPGELILVRPDGYLAARVPAGQEAELIDHLAACTPPAWHLGPLRETR
ncbi:FAD-dependent monooxygenase [Streptomyces sp. NPDC003688]